MSNCLKREGSGGGCQGTSAQNASEFKNVNFVLIYFVFYLGLDIEMVSGNQTYACLLKKVLNKIAFPTEAFLIFLYHLYI